MILYLIIIYEFIFNLKSMISKLIQAVEGKDGKYYPKFNISQRTVKLMIYILIKNPVKSIKWDDLFKRKLTTNDINDFFRFLLT